MVVCYRGEYTRTGKESTSVYAIKEETSTENFSSLIQIWNFRFLDESLKDKIIYFGFQTQRLNSYPGITILLEIIFCTVTNENNEIIGNLLGQITYPDKGSGDVSSPGTSIYNVYSSQGIFQKIKCIKIQFFPDLSRKVYFCGAC